MNSMTAPIRTKPLVERSPLDDELGWVEYRTQTDDERSWRAAITPREGFKLVVEDIDDVRFRIKVVAEDEPEAKATENAPATLAREDLEVVAAQQGVTVKPGDRTSDIQYRIGQKAKAKQPA